MNEALMVAVAVGLLAPAAAALGRRLAGRKRTKRWWDDVSPRVRGGENRRRLAGGTAAQLTADCCLP